MKVVMVDCEQYVEEQFEGDVRCEKWRTSGVCAWWDGTWHCGEGCQMLYVTDVNGTKRWKWVGDCNTLNARSVGSKSNRELRRCASERGWSKGYCVVATWWICTCVGELKRDNGGSHVLILGVVALHVLVTDAWSLRGILGWRLAANHVLRV